MTNCFPCFRTGLGQSIFLSLCTALLPQSTAAQSWQRVVSLNDKPGSAIGGGAGNTLYAGLASGHVFRSDNNGLAWTVVTNGLVDKSGAMLPAKAFIVTATGRVLRGGDNASWNNKIGSPIFRTDDAGSLWNEVPLPFASPTRNPAGIGISDFVIHKGSIYFSDLLSEGVWKSSDNGATWTSVGEALPSPPFVTVAKTYYAIASAGDALLTIQAAKGVFRSTDGGVTWAQAVNGIPGVADSPLVGGRTWSGSDVVGAPDGTAFAVSDGRLYRSRDGGASWTEVGEGILQSPHPFVPSIIQPSARKVELLGDRVYVSSADGNPRFWEGTLLDDSWTELPVIPGNNGNGSILAQSFAAHNGALYFAGSSGIHRLELATAVRTNLLPIVTTSTIGPFGINVGGTLHLATTVRGTAPFNYQWRLNGVPVAGQTGPELSFGAVSTNQSGTLSVVVSNAAGSVTNVPGALSVAPTGPGYIDYGFPLVNTTNSLLDIIPLPVTVNTFAFGPDGSVYFSGDLYSSKEGYTGIRRVLADGTPDRSFVTSTSAPGASAGTITTLLPLNDGTLLVGASGTGNDERAYRRLFRNGSLDGSLPWPSEVAGGPRKIVRLSDGRFLIGGGSAGGIRRLNGDGTFDPTFQGPVSIGRFQGNYVTDFALLPDGRVLIVGNFNEVDGALRVGVARLLPSGALDRYWVPAPLPPNSTTVKTLAVLPDGKLLLGGVFDSAGGQPHRNLVRLNADGTLDTTLGDLIPTASPDASVNALAVQPDGRVWVGGGFTGVASRNYLFRLDPAGKVDTSFPDIAINGAVKSLQLTPDGRLWIGGAATRIGGYPAGTPARIFTDLAGPTMAYAGFDQTPDAGTPLTLRGVASGPFTALQWRFNGAPIPGATGLTLSLGAVTPANSGNYELVVTSVGGSYTSLPANVRVRGPVVIDRPPVPLVGFVSNSVTFSVIAFGRAPLAYQWSREGVPLANATNRTLTLTNLQPAIAGGYSVKITGGDGSFVSSDPATLTVIPTPGSKDPGFRLSLFRPPNGGTAFLNDFRLLPDGRILVGGTFATTTNGPLAMLARLLPDGSVDPTFTFDPARLSSFEAVDLQSDGRIIILVRSSAGGGPYLVRRLKPNGAADPTFPEPGLPAPGGISVAPDDSIVVMHASGLSRLDANGTPDAAFATRAKFDVAPASVSLDPAGRIYAAGFFNTVGGQPRSRLARLLPNGAFDAAFAPTNALYSTVTALPNGVLGLSATGFTRFDESGRPDPNFAWALSPAALDLTGTGGLIGVLGTTFGDGIVLNADGTDAAPISRLRFPGSFGGYRKLRIGADGAIWLLLGSNSSFTEPASLLFKLNGTVTPLVLTVQPISQNVSAGTGVTFSVAAAGTAPFTYQWRRNGLPIAGATQAELVIPKAQPAANGEYTVMVSDRFGSLLSRSATLVVTGGVDGDPFAAWASAAQLAGAAAAPDADADHDGSLNLAEFYYGTSPTDAGAHPEFVLTTESVNGVGYPAVTVIRRQVTGPVTFTIRVSSGLDFGDDLGSTLVSSAPLSEGFERVVFRSNTSASAHAAQFFRLELRY